MAEVDKCLRLDLNNPIFQQQLFALSRQQQIQVIKALGKLSGLTWEQVYRDRGLHWEAIHSRKGPHGGRLYSLCMGKAFRALAWRDGDWLRLLSLHPDHDSAYH